MVIHGRTDLASEAQRLWRSSPERTSALSGVIAREETLYGFPVCGVTILDEAGAQALGKPIGRYYTLEPERFFGRSDGSFSDSVRALAALIRRCLPEDVSRGVLVAALGNPDITPDALGPLTGAQILVTRHLKTADPSLFSGFASTALSLPGVLGTTGVESAVQLRALCGALSPSCVIAVDALAGSDLSRLCRSVQVCSSGVSPGSGVGNDRERLDESSLGVPVAAIGIPTVVDAASFSEEKAMQGLFVTPREIDTVVRRGALLIGYAINCALHRELTVEEIAAYLD